MPETSHPDSGTVVLRSSRRPKWVVAACVFAALFTVYAVTACRGYTHIDAQAATVESWRIAAAGDPWLDNVITPSLAQNKFIGEAVNGHVVGMRMAGPVLVGIPFYLLLNHDSARGAFTLLPGGLAAATCACLAVLMMFLALGHHTSTRWALLAALVLGLATPTWSVSANMLWTHPVTQLGIAGSAYALSTRRWWLAGAFLAFGMLGRPHIAVIAAVVGLGMSWSYRSWRPVVQVSLPTMGALCFLELWNRWMFGTWSIGGAYTGRFESAVAGFHGSSEWDGPHAQVVNVLGFLFSADRGFFVWTPAVLLCIPVVALNWRSAPVWSRWLLVGGMAYTFFQLRVNYFPGGDGFYGYRHGLELLTCLVPVCALCVGAAGKTTRGLLILAVGVQLGAISWGAITEGFFIPIEKVWTDNSFWLALRHYPLLGSTWLGGAIAVVALTTRLVGEPVGDQNGGPIDGVDPGVMPYPGLAAGELRGPHDKGRSNISSPT